MNSHNHSRLALLTLVALSTFILALASAGCGGGSSSTTTTTTTTGGGGGAPPPPNEKEWTWVSGSNDGNSSSNIHGVYGTQGVAAATNVPPGRDGAVSWTDSSGNLWLFGGGGIDPLGTNGPFNDLWQFNLTSKQWTWVSGSDSVPGNQRGIYGTQGVAAAANVPGGRSASTSWIDASGNLWLFGGGGFDANGSANALNDLWEFNPSTKQWTWIGGSNTIIAKAVYGALGVAAATNNPGAREHAVSWIDRSGNLWLFGGDGFDDAGAYGSFNDLWEFSPSTKQWTWISGNTTINAPGVSGTEGTAAASNVPGARTAAVSWTDASANLWLFGGLGYAANGSQYELNDLWEFTPSAKQWTWISGTGSNNTGAECLPGVYGTEGTAAAGSVPGGRSASTSWIDASGNLWLFGGGGCDASGTLGSLNDLWEYNVSGKMWTWQSGSNSVGPPNGGTGGQIGVYGTQGVAAASNMPGGRSGAVSWIDSSGNFWLFGGAALDATVHNGDMNDLWNYLP
jgi:N-acetylneuraminic acid mutarotase